MVIDLFADSLRMKAMEIKEFIEDQSPLDTRQLKRLRRMNRSMKARCRRMRQAWREHDPDIDTVDYDCLEELDEIVEEARYEVTMTAEVAYAVLAENGFPRTTRSRRGCDDEEQTVMEQGKAVNVRHGADEAYTHAKPTGGRTRGQESIQQIEARDNLPLRPTRPETMKPKTRYAESTRRNPPQEKWEVSRGDNNEDNTSQRQLESLQQGRRPTRRQVTRGDSESKRRHGRILSEDDDSDESRAVEPTEKKAREATIKATPVERTEDGARKKRLANEYREYTEAFEEWTKKTGHGLNRQEAGELHENIKRLLQERDEIWNENQEGFRNEEKYGLMKLQYDMAKKSLGDMSNWIDINITMRAATRDEKDGKPGATADLAKEKQGNNEATKTLSKSQQYPMGGLETNKGRDGSSRMDACDADNNSTKAAQTRTSHWCEFTKWPNQQMCKTGGEEAPTIHDSDTSSDGTRATDEIDTSSEDETTEERTTGSESSTVDSGEETVTELTHDRRYGNDGIKSQETEDNDRHGADIDAKDVHMVTPEAALVDHREDTTTLPNGIRHVYITRKDLGSAFFVALPKTRASQHWCIIRANAARPTIDYRNSRLTIRTDKLRALAGAMAEEENAVYIPISSQKQTERFGIYISPKMSTHAFVGPFEAPAINDGGGTPAPNNNEVAESRDSGKRPTTVGRPMLEVGGGDRAPAPTYTGPLGTPLNRQNQSERALTEEPPPRSAPRESRRDTNGAPPLPPQLQGHVNEGQTDDGGEIGDAAARRRAIARHKPQPNRPPERTGRSRAAQAALTPPAQGGGRPQQQ